MKKKIVDILIAIVVTALIALIFLMCLFLAALLTSNSSTNQNHESGDINEETIESMQPYETIPRIISTTKPGTFEGGGSYAIYAEGYGLVGIGEPYLGCSTAISKPLEIYSAGYTLTLTLAENDAYKEFTLTAGDAKTLECESGSGYSVYLYVIVT